MVLQTLKNCAQAVEDIELLLEEQLGLDKPCIKDISRAMVLVSIQSSLSEIEFSEHLNLIRSILLEFKNDRPNQIQLRKEAESFAESYSPF